MFSRRVDWSGCARLLREKRVQGRPHGYKERQGRTARGKRVPAVE
ncbi:hypothetical protein AAEY33_22355 [Peribacillus simplex]